MKRSILKLIVLSLLVSTPFVISTGPGNAQGSRDQNSKAISAPAAPAEKTVEQVGKNIQVLKGMPQSQLYPAMRFMAASLGFQCGSCHVIKNGFIDAPVDDKPEKQTARRMIKMVAEINKTLGEGRPSVSCYTCHQGHRLPQSAPALPLPFISSRPPIASTPGPTSALPSVDEVWNKYLAAIGGKAATDRIKNCVVKGTTTISGGQVVAYEAEQSAPDKGHESFAIQNLTGRNCAGDSRCEYERVVNGQQGWLKSGGGVQELVGEQLADQRLSFPFFGILKLKDQYSSSRLSGRDKIDDRDVYVVNAIRLDNKAERLYFDVESGLLIRRIGYARTLIGTIPQQTDFDDYREVGGLRLPFTITMSFADPSSLPIVRKFTEIKLNVPLEESKFDKPTPNAAP